MGVDDIEELGTVRLSRLLVWPAAALLLFGMAAGWLIPELPDSVTSPIVAYLRTPLAQGNLNIGPILGAGIATFTVVNAVLISYVSASQYANRAFSAVLGRLYLLGLLPLLTVFGLIIAITMLYLMMPPTFVGQIWEFILWYFALVILLIAAVMELPDRLSERYVALWAIRWLRDAPVEAWIANKGYAILQAGTTAAITRVEVGFMRSMAFPLGAFLSSRVEADKDAADIGTAERLRPIRDLVSALGSPLAQAPTAFAYCAGSIIAGASLELAANPAAADMMQTDVFDDFVRALSGAPDRFESLWAGMQHSLCRRGVHGEPYLLRYWTAHIRWSKDDARRVHRVAHVIVALLAKWQEVRLRQAGARQGGAKTPQMIDDLCLDIEQGLMNQVVHHTNAAKRAEMVEMLHSLVRDIRATAAVLLATSNDT